MFNTTDYFLDYMPTSKVWIFTSPQKLNVQALNTITNSLHDFVSNWQSHGHPLEAAFELVANRFIIVCVNDNAASAGGCSIDKLFHIIHTLSVQTGYDLLDRSLCAYTEGSTVEVLKASDFKAGIKSQWIKADTLVFNNSISTLHELRNEWCLPLSQSAFKNWLPVAKV